MSETYSGIRESRPNRYNDICSTGEKASKDFKKGCLKKADRSFAQGLQCQQINSMAALMSLEDAVFIATRHKGVLAVLHWQLY